MHFDTAQAYDRLKESGIPPKQAKAYVGVLIAYAEGQALARLETTSPAEGHEAALVKVHASAARLELNVSSFGDGFEQQLKDFTFSLKCWLVGGAVAQITIIYLLLEFLTK
jgi:hypothetical protein